MATNIVNLLSIVTVTRSLSLYLSDTDVYRLIECSKIFKDLQGLSLKKWFNIGEICQMYIYRETKVNIKVVMNTPNYILSRYNIEEVLIDTHSDYSILINNILGYVDITLILLNCPTFRVTSILDERIKNLRLSSKSYFDSDFFPKYLEHLDICIMGNTDGIKTLPDTLVTLNLCHELPACCKLPKSLKNLIFRYSPTNDEFPDISDTCIETLTLNPISLYLLFNKLPKTLKKLSIGFKTWNVLDAKSLPNLRSLTIINFDPKHDRIPLKDDFSESIEWLILDGVKYRSDDYFSKQNNNIKF